MKQVSLVMREVLCMLREQLWQESNIWDDYCLTGNFQFRHSHIAVDSEDPPPGCALHEEDQVTESEFEEADDSDGKAVPTKKKKTTKYKKNPDAPKRFRR